MLALRYRDDIKSYDLADDGDGFLQETTLATIEKYSLHIDRRGVGRNGTMERGYWAAPSEGSLIWTHIGLPITDSRLELIAADIRKSLRRLIEDKVCTKIEVSYERFGPDRGLFYIKLIREDGQVERYKEIWERTLGFDG